jgi:hypothetical protein
MSLAPVFQVWVWSFDLTGKYLLRNEMLSELLKPKPKQALRSLTNKGSESIKQLRAISLT